MDETTEADLQRLRRALEVVEADLDRTHADAPRLQILVLDEDPGEAYDYVAYVADQQGSYWSNVSPPLTGSSEPLALAAVAEGVQEYLAEESWQVWPLCPDHGIGVHLRPEDAPATWDLDAGWNPDSAPVWWCKGDGGHQLGRVGHLGPAASAGAARPRHRKHKRHK